MSCILQLVVARKFDATFVQLDVVCACCVLGVSWPRLVPCVLANRFVCGLQNRSVCKIQSTRERFENYTLVCLQKLAAATGAAKSLASKSSGSRIKQWQHQRAPTAPTTAVAAVAWPFAVGRSNRPACVRKRAARPLFFFSPKHEIGTYHSREPTTPDLRTRLERENDMSHTEIISAQRGDVETVRAHDSASWEGESRRRVCMKTKETRWTDDSKGEWRENDETQWRDYVVGEFRETLRNTLAIPLRR